MGYRLDPWWKVTVHQRLQRGKFHIFFPFVACLGSSAAWKNLLTSLSHRRVGSRTSFRGYQMVHDRDLTLGSNSNALPHFSSPNYTTLTPLTLWYTLS
jgi:hypothetical protein